MLGSADSRQWGAGAAFETGRYVPSDGTDTISENGGVVSNQIDIQPADCPEPSNDVSLLSHASIVSLFQPQTSRMDLCATVPIEHVEMEPIPLTPGEQEGGETAATSQEPVLESSAGIRRESGEELEDMVEMTAIPDNGRS